MSRRLDPLSQISDQMLLRDLSRLSALRKRQSELLSEADGELARAAAEAARIGVVAITPGDALALERYVSACKRRGESLRQKSEALSPEIEEARHAAQRAFGRARAIDLLRAREAKLLAADAARREERSLSSIAAVRD